MRDAVRLSEAKVDRILARSLADGDLQMARGDYAWSSSIWVRATGGV